MTAHIFCLRGGGVWGVGHQNLHSQGRLFVAAFVHLGGPLPRAHTLSVSSAVGSGGAYSPSQKQIAYKPHVSAGLLTPGHCVWVCYEDTEFKCAMNTLH